MPWRGHEIGSAVLLVPVVPLDLRSISLVGVRTASAHKQSTRGEDGGVSHRDPLDHPLVGGGGLGERHLVQQPGWQPDSMGPPDLRSA